MYFALKFAFWLSIVFSCMNWPDGGSPQAVARQAAGEFAERTRSIAIEKAGAVCADAPGKCLAAAGHATVLARRLTPARDADRTRSVD